MTDYPCETCYDNATSREAGAALLPKPGTSEPTLRIDPNLPATARTSDDAYDRADDLVRQMTLEEKIDYIGGAGFSIRAIPRLDIPEIVMADGPMGCRCYGKAAALPGGIALAATWNTELAREVGVALGRQCRARGVHILLAPGVNIYRSPTCARNFEYMGEDPFLTSTMVIPHIDGLQSQQVFATIKHFACNNQEWDRHNVSSEVDERTLREIYLPAFKAAVQKARSKCLMAAYNLVNGVHCTPKKLPKRVQGDFPDVSGFRAEQVRRAGLGQNPETSARNHGPFRDFRSEYDVFALD